MPAPAPFGRPRVFTDKRRARLLELVNHGTSVEEAAELVGVSLRTVQREAKHDEFFDHDLQAALRNTDVDCEKLMLRAARTHWRAAAWMLERRDPDKYSKRPPNSCSPENLLDIMAFLIETALEATPPEHREAVYRRTQIAADKAFDLVMPGFYEGRAAAQRIGIRPTPISDQLTCQAWRDAQRPRLPPGDDEPEKMLLPLREPAATAAEDPRQRLSPKTSAATKVSATEVAERFDAPTDGAQPDLPQAVVAPKSAAVGKISPLNGATTPSAMARAPRRYPPRSVRPLRGPPIRIPSIWSP